MPDATSREPARDPQDLERLLIDRQWAGDIEGMLALSSSTPLSTAAGRVGSRPGSHPGALRRGPGHGQKVPARGAAPCHLINGDLALTSTRLPDGSITAEVARRQRDGTWLWAIDRYAVAF
ncbi:MAG: hypothetical protein AB1440_09390 [Pseudomonadota bacterium]|jgi:hypothetical protein